MLHKHERRHRRVSVAPTPHSLISWRAAFALTAAQLLQGKERPKKRLYRARAHSNPLNDAHFPVPSSPEAVDWCAAFRMHAQSCTALRAQATYAKVHDDCHYRAALYPERFAGDGDDGEADAPMVRFADVGCGFGGLLIRLSPLYPDKLMIGFELRDKARRCCLCAGGTWPNQAWHEAHAAMRTRALGRRAQLSTRRAPFAALVSKDIQHPLHLEQLSWATPHVWMVTLHRQKRSSEPQS